MTTFCDACDRHMPCCSYRETPHGDGSFCHICCGHTECDACAETKWVVRLRSSPKDAPVYMGANLHWEPAAHAFRFDSHDDATVYAQQMGYEKETRVEVIDDEI